MTEQAGVVTVDGRKYDSDLKTDEDRKLADCNRQLFDKLARYLHSLDRMTTQTYDRMVEIIENHRANAALRYDVHYPELVAVWLDRIRAVKLIRADIDRKALETTLVNWTVEHPDVSAGEIARAITRHFPGYAPASLVA